MPKIKRAKPKKNPTPFDLVLAERARVRQAKLDQEIIDYLAFTAEHPSVHERMADHRSPQEHREDPNTQGHRVERDPPPEGATTSSRYSGAPRCPRVVRTRKTGPRGLPLEKEHPLPRS
jgi:hypothetical protein